jgi:two-component system, NtrC family, response regulator PilR
VLVVDDDPTMRTFCEEVLCHRGYRVMVAASVAEALEILRDQPADLVIADYRLEDGTGCELIHQASNQGLFDAHVSHAVICTAYRYVEPPLSATILHKPLDEEDLIDRVDEAFGVSARRVMAS